MACSGTAYLTLKKIKRNKEKLINRPKQKRHVKGRKNKENRMKKDT
jgi:hypothetical protein